MITRTECYRSDQLVEGINIMEEAGWATRHITEYISYVGWVVVFERNRE